RLNAREESPVVAGVSCLNGSITGGWGEIHNVNYRANILTVSRFSDLNGGILRHQRRHFRAPESERLVTPARLRHWNGCPKSPFAVRVASFSPPRRPLSAVPKARSPIEGAVDSRRSNRRGAPRLGPTFRDLPGCLGINLATFSTLHVHPRCTSL